MGLETEADEFAQRLGHRWLPASHVPWLSVRGHLDAYVQNHAPAETIGTLAAIHADLGGDAVALAAKRSGSVCPDLVTAEGQIVEVDEVQHFTTARERTLRFYTEDRGPFGFDVPEYRRLVARWRGEGDRAFAHKTSADFNFRGGRQAQRAYNDAPRDLLAPVFTGLPVRRIPVPDRNVARALREALAEQH